MRQIKKVLVFLSVVFLLSSVFISGAQAAPIEKLTKKQSQTVNDLFRALATSDPDRISAAKRKHVVVGTPAYFYVQMIENHFSTVRYYKSINNLGIPSGVVPAAEPKGIYSSTKRGIRFDGPVDAFDGFNSNFKFNKNGKLRSWTVGTLANKNRLTLNNRIFPITSNISQTGFEVNGGYIYRDPMMKATAQLRVKNISTNLKSWSFAGGNYGGPDGKYLDLESVITGCLYMQQTAFFEAKLPSWPLIVGGTQAVINPPVFNGCGGGSSQTSAVFRFQTGG